MPRPSRLALPLLAVLVSLGPLSGQAQDRIQSGPVLAIGGGKLTDAIVDRLVELTKGGRLVVCPAASGTVEGSEPDRFRERGAKDVVVVDFRTKAEADDPARAAALESAGGIFFTGGDQNRLLETLKESKALAALRVAHEHGAVVAGTSAGCAALGDWSLLGDGEPDTIRAGATPGTTGLGLCPGAILDQHFLARRRHNRLVSALLEHPGKVGVGIDERTAVLWRGSSLEVLGDGMVSVYLPAKEARSFTLRLLTAGEKLELLKNGAQ